MRPKVAWPADSFQIGEPDREPTGLPEVANGQLSSDAWHGTERLLLGTEVRCGLGQASEISFCTSQLDFETIKSFLLLFTKTAAKAFQNIVA